MGPYVLISLVALLISTVHAQVPEQEVGVYQCPGNKVLAVTDIHTNAIYMQCLEAPICEQPVSCLQTPGPCPPANPQTLEFLSGIVENEQQAEYTSKTCCHMQPRPYEYSTSTCVPISIVDITPWVDGWVKQTVPDNVVASQRRSKRQTLQVLQPHVMGYTYTFLHDNYRRDKYLYVNDIRRLPTDDGYTVVVCRVNCDGTTTSTRRTTTTERDSNEASYEDPSQEIDEIPDGTPDGQPGSVLPPDGQQPNQGLPSIDLGNLPGFGAGAICFAGENTVETPFGPKPLSEVQINEKVLVDGGRFEPIEFWYHRRADESAAYVQLTTTHIGENGVAVNRTLTISDAHLLPAMPCHVLRHITAEQAVARSRFAAHARVGDCVLVTDGSGALTAAPIVNVRRHEARGVYSPITPSGTIMVSGVHTSCFSTMENHALQHALHQQFTMKMYGAFSTMADGWETAKKWVTHATLNSLLPVLTGDADLRTDDGSVPAGMHYASYVANVVAGDKMF